MIRIDDISFRIEGKPLFEGASATIPSGHKVGIVGRNGTGKTTLFHLITGHLHADGGSISVPKGARVGGVSQEAPSSDISLIETVLAADTERASLFERAECETDPNKIAEIHTRLNDLDAYGAEARAAQILHGLGFDVDAQQRTCAEFSGGWRMRVALASILFAQPDILLLDEPTNYLDLEGTVWLQSYLARYPFTVLVISHDRALLNESVGAILHLHDKRLTLYQGGYDSFDAVRRAKLAEQASNAKKQEASRAHLQSFVDRFRAKASKAKQAQSRLKMLERMQPIASSAENAVAGFNFKLSEELSPPILRLDDVSVGYDGTAILSELSLRVDPTDRIALLGANGEGKSTFSKLLAGKLKPMSGQIVASSKLKVGYFAQHQVDELHLDETPLQHIARALPHMAPAQLRGRLAQGGIGPDQVDTEVTRLSGGQKARLSLLLATLHAPQLLLLDEPTNHLDIESREALALALADYEGAVILVSHDPHLINAVSDQLWLVKGGKVKVFTEDISTYQNQLLSERGGPAKKLKQKSEPKPKRLSSSEIRKLVAPLQAEVTKCEERVQKIEDMRDKIDARLADPSFYTMDDGSKIEELNKKRGEIIAALDKAEELWLRATDALETAKNSYA